MGLFRFRRSIKMAPGLRWNIGKRSTSFSIGPRGLKLTAGTRGVRTTVGIPGTGLSYTSQSQLPHVTKPAGALADRRLASTGRTRRTIWTVVAICLAGAVIAEAVQGRWLETSVAVLLVWVSFRLRGRPNRELESI